MKYDGEIKMKELYLLIKTCNTCPYCEYDGYYDMHNDSGYKCTCNDSYNKIVDDSVFVNKSHPDRTTKLTPDGKIKIPEWCPLPDKK